MLKKITFGGVGLVLLAAPLFTSALTVQEQIAALMAQFQQLQLQITALSASISNTGTSGSSGANGDTAILAPGSGTPGYNHLACNAINRRLYRGLNGADVMALQDFLIAEGLLAPGSVSGYFGVQTESAVQLWQSSHSIVSSGDPETTGWGVVGPQTHMAMRQPDCGGTTNGEGSSDNSAASTITSSVSGNAVTVAYVNLPVNSYIQIINQSNDVVQNTLTPLSSGTGSITVSSIPAGTYILRAKRYVSGTDPIMFESSPFTVGGTTVTASIGQTKDTTTSGESYGIWWSSTNATACTVDYTENGGLWIFLSSTLGGAVTPQSPTGTYQARITCTGAGGTTATKTITHTTTAGATTSGGTPTAQATPRSGAAPLLVTFSIANSRGTADNGVYYTITFGDGQAAGFSRGGPFTLSHTYSSSGTYTATLREGTQCGTWECIGPVTTVGTVTITVSAQSTTATPNSVPIVTTLTPTNLTPTSVTLNGSVNSAGTTGTTGWFRASGANPGTCNDAFGIRSTGDTAFTPDYRAVPYSLSVSGLTPSTIYYYCAIGGNSYGTNYGTVVSFTTLASSGTTGTTGTTGTNPIVATLTQTSASTAVNVPYTFTWGSTNAASCTVSYTGPDGGGTISSGSTNGSHTYNTPTAGTYVATNICTGAGGTATQSLTHIVTAATTNTTNTTPSSSAAVSGAVSGSTVTATYAYLPQNSYVQLINQANGSTQATIASNISGTGNASVSSVPAGTYILRVKQSASGADPLVAESSSFTVAGAASSAPTATLTQTSSSSDAGTAYSITWGSTNATSCTVSYTGPDGGGTISSGSTNGSHTYNTPTAGTYVATNICTGAGGATASQSVTHTVTATATPNSPPTVVTLAPSNITSTLVTLNGSVNSAGTTGTTGWFRADTTSPGTCNDTFGTRSGGTDTSFAAEYQAVPYSLAVTGLIPGTTYYYCAIASNPYGKSYGGVRSFTAPQY